MIVHYLNMTGEELHKIYKLSGLTQDSFMSRLGMKTRSQLINQFNRRNERIDEDIEKIVNDIPEFAQHKLLVVNKQNDVQSNEGGEVVKFLTDTIQVLRDVITKGEKQTAMMEKVVESLTSSNSHIREEALTYRKMIQDGYDAGLLKWAGKGK